jgi:NDP-sugar pyrophosphorylase family protein
MGGMTSVGGHDAASPLPPVCILAGGLGTRLGERVRDTPKPLLAVAGEPFLCHQLRLLAANRAEEVVLCVGYRGEQIKSLLGNERFGIRIRYSFDGPHLDGTLGAVRRALPLLGERFLVLNGDTYLPIDYAAAVAAWRASGLPAMMSVLRNDGCWEPSNASYADGRVLAYEKGVAREDLRWIDCGLGGLLRTVVERSPCDGVTKEDRDLASLMGELAREELLCGVETTIRYYEIGTPGALAQTDSFLRGLSGAPGGEELRSRRRQRGWPA